MGYQEAQLLGTLRISKMVSALVDPREIPGDLLFLKRTPIVPTTDSEIIARVLNQIVTADIIADDQAAHTYAAQRVKFEMNHIPNIKIGQTMTASTLQLYNQISAAPQAATGDISMFTDYLRNAVNNVIRGVRQRMEALIIAMHCDVMSPAYSKLGIMFGSDVTWGMWPDLKTTALYAWSDTVNATPIDDLLNLALVGSTKYGKVYDRVTMSTALFREMIATAQFQSRAKVFIPAQLVTGAYTGFFSLVNLKQQRALAVDILGMDVELYDARYPQMANDGTPPSYTPYLQLNTAILSMKSNDNDRNIMDFGNTMPTETLMGEAPSIIGGGFPTPQYGPIAYSALTNAQLNPPGYTTWGVARGFPRKFDQAATAALTAGVVIDILSPTIDFST